MRRCFAVLLVLACVGGAVSPRVALAQGQGSITGVVKDASGAVLPGVTVEVVSPALIEKTRSVVADGSGQYRFINLVPGSYTVTFTLPGFTTVKREGVEVTGAFVATINVEMRVGAIEETISVTGETPIVDVQSTTKQRVVTRETMDAVPTSRVPYELAVLVPGVTARNNSGTAAVQDVGGTAGNQAQNGLVSHGSKTTDMRVTYNGVMLATMETGKNAGVLSNTAAYQEITVDNSAVSAELSTGGPRLNLIPREGGNIFHGSLFGSFTNHSLQGSNFTSDLQSRGLATADSMKKLWDLNPGFGGPLLRDKLWFFTTVRHNGWQNNPGGFIANLNGGNPDSFAYAPDPNQPQSADSWWFDAQARITWQATPRNKIAFTYDKQVGVLRTGSATTAPEAVTPSRYDPKSNIFLDWTAPLTNRLLVEAVAVSVYELFQSMPEDNPYYVPGRPLIGISDQASGVTYRGSTGVTSHWTNNNYYYRASLAYVTGAHNFKLGFNNAGGTRDALTAAKLPAISYRVNNGVPNQITAAGDSNGGSQPDGRGSGDLRAGSMDGAAHDTVAGRALRLLQQLVPRSARGTGRARAGEELRDSRAGRRARLARCHPEVRRGRTTSLATARRRYEGPQTSTCKASRSAATFPTGPSGSRSIPCPGSSTLRTAAGPTATETSSPTVI